MGFLWQLGATHTVEIRQRRKIFMVTRERTKKNAAPPLVEVLTVESPAEAEIIDKQVVHTERYIERVPVDRQASAASLPLQAPEAPPAPPETPDDIEAFLLSLTDDENYVLRVDQMPDFQHTMRFGRGVRTIYMGEIVFNPSTYLRDIQSMFGPGDYRLTVFRQPGHTFKKRWAESIAAPRQPPGSTPAPAQNQMTMVPYQAQAPVAPVDPFDGLFTMAERFAKLQKALIIQPAQQTNNQPQGQSNNPAPNISGDVPQDRVLASLLELAGKNDGLATKLLGRYLGESDEGPPWWATLLEKVAPVILPQLLPRLLAWLPPIAPGPGQAPQLAGMPPPFQIPPPPSFVPPPPPGAAQGVADSQPPMGLEVFTEEPPSPWIPQPGEANMNEPDAPQFVLIDDLVLMLRQCLDAGKVIESHIETGAAAVRKTAAANPDLQGMISMLVTGTPDGAMGMLTLIYPELAIVRSHPVAIASIEALQKALTAPQMLPEIERI
jgi:hypothetical protein